MSDASASHWVVPLDDDATFEEWQPFARYLLHADVSPDAVLWQASLTEDLWSCCGDENTVSPEMVAAFNQQRDDASSVSNQTVKRSYRVPREFIQIARFALCINDSRRFAMLYQLLWRITHGERDLLQNVMDPCVITVNRWVKTVARERHKMHAFVRFRKVGNHQRVSDSEFYIAWFEPQHFTLKLGARFFCERFPNMEWSILTPYLSAHWRDQTLTYTQGCGRDSAPDGDCLDSLWRVYYANIFNPARLKVKAMCSEMPKKYWHNLPEAELIQPLIEQAEKAKQAMLDKAPSEPKLPAHTLFDRDQWLSAKK